MLTVVVTDYTFDDLGIEKAILEPLGCRIISQKVSNGVSQLIRLVQDADYVITQYASLDAEVIRAMRKCKLIVRYGIGVDNIDIDVAAKRGIPVCNIPDFCIDEVADHTLALILELTRRVSQNAATVRKGRWELAVPLEAMRVLRDMTIGIVGFGRIGREVASRLKPFKCRILVADPGVPPDSITEWGCLPAGLRQMFGQSDLVTLHCPSTKETRHIINTEAIKSMKPGVLLVNVSRGSLISTKDLINALQQGDISAAALDVVDPEPLDKGSELLQMPNVIVNAHIAYSSPKAMSRLRQQTADLLARAVQGGDLVNIVNGVGA